MSNQFPPIEIFPDDYSFRLRFPPLTSEGSDTGKWSQLPTACPEGHRQSQQRRTLMKNVSVTMGLAALMLAGAIKAQDITIKWKVKGDPLLTFDLPKVASDGIQNVALIAEGHKGLKALEDELGSYQPLAPAQVVWSGS